MSPIYRKKLTPNITCQPNKIFVRKDLFEEIIKRCKLSKLEFLKLKEKLGLFLYQVICDEQEFISRSEEIFKKGKGFAQHDVENKQLKEENDQLVKENEELRKNHVTKDATTKASIKKTMEIKSPKEDINRTDYPNWFDKIKFKKMLAIIDRKKFNYKNKIGEFKYIELKSWLIILEIIQLVKYLLKRFKYIKQNKKCGNNKT